MKQPPPGIKSYLGEIQDHRVLTREEEFQLFERYHLIRSSSIPSGGLAANNGLAIGQGSTRMRLSWSDAGEPQGTAGYHVHRSSTGLPGSYQRINPSLIIATSYSDSGLSDETTYFYKVYIIDADSNATQWTSPFFGRTLTNGAQDWRLFE
jgi:hypothetical protein